MTRYFQINAQGCNIRCKLYCPDNKDIRRMVVFCHGFGGHKDNAAAEKFAQRLLSKYKDAAMVTFNWPCHGDDVRSKLTLPDCDLYLQQVLQYIRDTYAPEAIYAYATSFGGYLTLRYIAAHGNPFRKIALRCPAVDMYRVLTERILTPENLTRMQKGKDIPVGFDRKVPVGLSFLESLRSEDLRQLDFLDYAEDLLILHGTADELVPFDSAYSFADDNLIEFIAVEGADHRFHDPKKMEQAIKAICDFFGL